MFSGNILLVFKTLKRLQLGIRQKTYKTAKYSATATHSPTNKNPVWCQSCFNWFYL